MQDVTDPDLRRLRALAGRLIPCSAGHAVPGADDPSIFADAATELDRAPAMLEGLLAILRPMSVEEVVQHPLEALLLRLQTASDGGFFVFAAAVIQAYYRDDRVLRSLAIEPRPPFPKGYVVEDGDLSLLDPVRARGPIWRRAT